MIPKLGQPGSGLPCNQLSQSQLLLINRQLGWWFPFLPPNSLSISSFNNLFYLVQVGVVGCTSLLQLLSVNLESGEGKTQDLNCWVKYARSRTPAQSPWEQRQTQEAGAERVNHKGIDNLEPQVPDAPGRCTLSSGLQGEIRQAPRAPDLPLCFRYKTMFELKSLPSESSAVVLHSCSFALWPLANDLSLSFFVCKMGLLIPVSQVCYRNSVRSHTEYRIDPFHT